MKPSIAIAIACLAACGAATVRPVALHTGEDACAQCRMTIVSTRTAAEIVSPGREPILFDELGCLRSYLAAQRVPDDAVIFVVDHRSGAWVDARQAIFTQTESQTPMASGLLAHADHASRDADPAASGGKLVAFP